MIPVKRQIEGRLVGRRVTALHARDVMTPGGTAPAGTVLPASALTGVVQKQLAGKFTSDPGIRFGDGMFYLPKVAEVQTILAASQTDRRTWMAERFDCDDFSYVLKGEMSAHAYESAALKFGLCVGLVWGYFSWMVEYHAVNWFVADDGALRFIEPQDDTIYDATHCRGNIQLLLV